MRCEKYNKASCQLACDGPAMSGTVVVVRGLSQPPLPELLGGSHAVNSSSGGSEQVKKRCRWLLSFSSGELAQQCAVDDPFGGMTVDANALGAVPCTFVVLSSYVSHLGGGGACKGLARRQPCMWWLSERAVQGGRCRSRLRGRSA